MKKLISLAICLAMVLAFSASGFAMSIGGGLPTSVAEFKTLVEAIGEVTLEDKEAIEAAERFYEEDSMLYKYIMDGVRQNATAVALYETLLAARATYDALVANQGSSEVAPGGDSSSEVAPGGDSSSEVAPGGGSSSEVAPGGDSFSEVAPGGDSSSEVAPGGDSSSEVAPGGDAETPDTPAEPQKIMIDFSKEQNATITADDSTTTDVPEDKVVWKENGITVTVERIRMTASGGTVMAATHNEDKWPDHTRFQKNNQVVIEYPNMKSITMNFQKNTYTGYMENSILPYPGLTVTKSEDQLSLTVTFSEPVDRFAIPAMNNTARILSLEITETFAEGEEGTPMQAPKTLTVKELSFTTVGGRWCYNKALTTSGVNTLYDMVIYDNKYEGELTMFSQGIALRINKYGELVAMYTAYKSAMYNADGETEAYYASPDKYYHAAFNDLEDGDILVIFFNNGNSNITDNYDQAMANLKDASYYGQKVTLTGFTFEDRNAPQPDPDQEAADAVTAQIEAIGEVTKDSQAAIEAARAAYNNLTDAQKKLVTNLDKLEDAEEALAELLKPTEPENPPVDPENPPVDPEDPEDPPVGPIDPTGDATFVVFALVALSMTGLVVLTAKKKEF